MASHAFVQDMPEPSFCPWKTVVSAQQFAGTATSCGKQDTHGTIQTISLNSGLDLLSNIAFLSGIIDSPTQFSNSPSQEVEGQDQRHLPVSETSSNEGRGSPAVSESSEDTASNSNQKDVSLDKPQITANYRPEVSSSPSSVSESATVVNSKAEVQSHVSQGLNHIQRSVEAESNAGRTKTVAASHRHKPAIASTQSCTSTSTSQSFHAPPTHHVLNNPETTSGIYAKMCHNRPETNSGYPLPLISNMPHMAPHNAFQLPFANIPYSQARLHTPFPRGTEENRQSQLANPWMFLTPTTVPSRPPASIHNWLADKSNMPRISEISRSNSQQFIATTNSSRPHFTSVSTPMVPSHLAPRPIFTGAVPPVATRYTSAAPATIVTPHAKESQFVSGYDDKTIPLSTSTAFSDCFGANLYSSGGHQQRSVKTTPPPPTPPPPVDLPLSDAESASDSAVCSPDSGHSYTRDTIHNPSSNRCTPPSGRCTPPSGIQNGSSSLQNISSASSCDHSSHSSLSDSVSSIFGRPVGSSDSPSSISFNCERHFLEDKSPMSTQTITKQESVIQDGKNAMSAFYSQKNMTLTASVSVKSMSSEISSDVIDKTKKKSRTNYTPAQVRSLERVFLENPYPESLMMEELSKTLNIPEQKLKVWFQNKRARWRRRVQENKVPPVHPLFMTPPSAYGMMRAPSLPGQFFPYTNNPTSTSSRFPCPRFPPVVQCQTGPPEMNAYMFQ